MSKLPKLHTQSETDFIGYGKITNSLLQHPLYDLAAVSCLHLKQDKGVLSFNKDTSLYF